MNNGYIKVWLAAAIAAGILLLLGLGRLFGGDYADLAGQLSGEARSRGIARIAVLDFSAGGGASPEEAAAAQLALSRELFRIDDAGVMDAAMLERLGDKGKLWPQALVKGGLYADGAGRVLVLKLLEPRSGRTIGAMQARLDPARRVPADLRDAPAGAETPPCARAEGVLQRLNVKLADLKARYWAERMRTPGFAPGEGETLPGSEIADYPARQQFYLLLNRYYESDGPVALSPDERAAMLKLRAMEDSYAANCAGP